MIQSTRLYTSETPLVSICCPTYNHERYIESALDGFLSQECDFPVEILINDDFSTDNTAKTIKKYQDKFPDIIKPVYQQENQFSKGLKPFVQLMFPRVQGKYIAMCEGDDCWTDPKKLQTQVDFLEENPTYTLTFHNALEVSETNKFSPRPFTTIEKRRYYPEEVLQRWTIPTGSVVMRNNPGVLSVPGKGIIHGDIYIFLNQAESGYLYGFPEIMSVYRRHPGGVTYGKTTIDSMHRRIGHYDALIELFGEKYLGICMRKKSQYNFALAKLYILKFNPFQVINYLCRSFFSSRKEFFVQVGKTVRKNYIRK